MLEGEGLKVGGLGLQKLYDTDFRNVVNNLPAVKKAGQKVGTASITVEPARVFNWNEPGKVVLRKDVLEKVAAIRSTWEGAGRTAAGWQSWNVGLDKQATDLLNEMGSGRSYAKAMEQFGSQTLAEKLGFGGKFDVETTTAPVPALTITPAIRDSVMGGQPLASLPQAALPEDPAEEPKREIHQIGGRQWFTEYPEALTAADYAKGREKLVNFVQNELFLPGFEHEKNIFVFKPDGETHEAEGRKLVDKLVEILQGQSDRKSDAAVMAPLITRMIDYNIDAIQQIFSKEIAGNLISLAGANASDYGQRLAMVKGDIPNDVTEVARNLNFNLRATYSNLAGGGAFDEVTMKRILTLFRTEFSDEELAKISAEHPTMTGFINDLIARMGQEGGNRLYRAVQNRLSPKNLSLKALEKNALFQEEVNAIIETLAKAGIKEPTDRPKLSPLEKLRLMVTDQSQVKINDAIEAAISTGEIEAGKQAARNATRGDKTALDELEQRYAAGELPSDDEIAEGLKLANFSKWQRLRDDWAKYDPVTVKLARQVAADDFKGLKFGTPKAKPADTRISINDLAKQPDAEIARVLDAYLQNIEANITMDNSSPETRQEVRRVIQEQLLSQINDVIRPKVRDAMFAEKKPGKSATPPDKRLAELANSKLFSDNRIDQAAELEKLSRKSAIQRLVPTVSGIAKEILSTPQIFQGDMPKNFVNEFIKKFTADFSVDESQVPGLRKAVTEAYAGKLKEAAKKAWESALKRMTPAEQAGMTPAEQAVMPKSDKRFWKILTQLANAGVLDSDEALRKIAAAKGHPMPTPEEVAGIKRSVERIEELENPTPAKRAKILNDPGLTPKEKSRQMRTEQRLASAANSGEIGQLQRKLGAQWSRLTKPFGLNPLTAEGRNTSQAIYQFSIANWLAKFRFPFTLAQHVWWQFVWSLLTRPPAVIWQMVEESKKADKPVEAWDTVHNVLQSTIKQWLDSLAPGIRAARGQMAGRGVNRNLEGLLLGVNALERAAEASKAYYTKGDKARAAATGFISLWRFALRVVGALDAFQGEQVEFQEIRNQYNIEMAKQGKTRAEIEMTWQQAWGDMKRKMAEALVEAREMAEAYHTDTSPNALKESADSLLKEHQWQWMELLGMQADSLRAQALRRRMGMAWQSPPASGSLGNVAYKGAQAWNKFVLSKNLPMFSAYFARAISNGMNYFGRFTPFYKAFTGRVNQKGEGSDFSNETEADRKENFIRGVIVGPLLGGLLAYLIYNRLAKVNSHYPTDKKEREKFINEGHKVNTIEFLNDDGSFIPFGLNIGPFSPVASYAVAAQAVMDQNDKYAKEQAKADAFAAAHGLPSKPIEHDWVIDDMEVAGKAAYQTILGSATAVGLTSGFNEFGIPNAKKAIASVLSPLVPGLPNYQSISHMMGVSLDSHMATVFDFMVPLPTSSARMVNALGDPVRTPNDIQRVVQELTGGSYPFPVDPKSVAQGHAAYQALFSTGYMPPPVSRARGYVINGEYRPMNDSELQQYTVARGQNFKANLAALGPNPTVEQVKGAYQQANASALAGVGAAAPTRPTASRRAGTSGSSRGSVARNAGVRSSAGRGLIRGSLKMRSGRRAGLRGLSGVRRSSSSMALSARRKSSGSSLRMKKRRARLV
jgi:hypothetical protein